MRRPFQYFFGKLCLALLAFACLALAAYAFTYLRVAPRFADNPFDQSFASQGLIVPAHFFGAGLALLLVPLQLSTTVRRRAPRIHRLGGWLSVAAILVSGIGGFFMAWHAQGGWASGTAFALLAATWLLCTGNGIRQVLAGNLQAHRRWMCRVVALTTSAITLRLILASGMILQLPPMPVYVFAAWSCWPINLVLAEWIMRYRPRPSLARSPPPRPGDPLTGGLHET